MDKNTLHNLNIERAVLSSILFDPSIYEDVAAKLKPVDFYLPDHKIIFESMGELEKADKPIDEEFLKKVLTQKEKFNEDIFIEIISSNPLSNSEAYIDEIKEKSVKRELVKLTTDIKSVAVDQDLPSSEVLDLVQKKLYEISMDAVDKEFRDSPEMVTATISHIHNMKQRGNEGVIGVDTGFRELNEKTAGFTEGQLIIIAARPAMGKTALTLNMAQKALDDGKGVAIFSLEMPAEELMLRMLSAKAPIPLQDLKVGNLSDEQWSDLTRASEEMSHKKLFVDDNGMVNINQLRSKLRKLKMQNPEISLAIIDYLQLMSGTGGKDRHLEVSEISRGLKLLARELDMPIIALSQLNRGVESRHDKRPMLSDIRESGSIEQDADIILFVYRDDIYKFREEKEKEKRAKAEGQEYRSTFVEKEEEDAELIIGKNRSGPIGVAHLVFQKRFTKFVDKGSVPVEIVFENAEENAKNSNFDMPIM
jgi:replicative DNA helicase